MIMLSYSSDVITTMSLILLQCDIDVSNHTFLYKDLDIGVSGFVKKRKS